MKLASLEIVRLLKPRLGFGKPESRAEPEQIQQPQPQTEALPEAAPPTPLPPAVPISVPASVEDLRVERLEPEQLSLVRLAEQLQLAMKAAPPIDARAQALESPKESAQLFAVPAVEKPAVARQSTPKIAGSLEGRKVAAVGFGRQDISGIASGLMDRRAQVQFVPRGVSQECLAEFDLLILNGASVETMKRDIAGFRGAIESGIPSIVVGSRATLNLLRDCGDRRTWDFISKPLHLDELAWRAENLLARQDETDIKRRMPARVVVADNDPFTRSLVESALTQLGIACESADEGDTAWTAIEKSQPGAVILDLTLPNRDGFQIMADIRRAAGRKPKIIVLSARQSEADVLRAFSLGADDYVTKPFSPLELGARLVRLLGGAPENA